MRPGRLSGLTAIVTGATSGIGAATCRLFAREGARLVLVGRRSEVGNRLVDDLGRESAVFLQGDVTSDETAIKAVELATGFSRVDVLVNSAGIDFTSDLLETSAADVRRVVETNFVGAFVMMREAARAMSGAGGSIVNVTSRLASIGVATMGIYSGSKGALLSLTRTAAIEWAPLGIRVNAVAPGLTETPLLTAWLAQQPDPTSFRKSVEGTVPPGRLGTPDDVASAILFFASPESAHVTGASLAVDGGYTAA